MFQIRWLSLHNEMHIGFISCPFTPGGAQRLVLEEIRYFRNEGYQVSAFTREDDPSFRAELGLGSLPTLEFPAPVAHVPSRFNRIREIGWLRSRLVDRDVDLTMSHYNDVPMYLSTRGLDIPHICHINDSPFWFADNPSLLPHSRKPGFERMMSAVDGHRHFQQPTESRPVRLYHEFREILRLRAVRTAVLTTTIADRVAEELSFCYGIDPKVIHPGVREDYVNRTVSASPDDIPGVETERMLLNVGRLDRRKRNALLLRAFARLVDEHERDDVTLVIVGTGRERAHLRELTSSLHIDEQVRFAGHVPEGELPTYYAAADLFTHPAWVAYGLVPLEAYALGTEVLISTDAMVREILEGEPGVSILPPTIDAWTQAIGARLDAPAEEVNRAVIPTWEEYCQKKHNRLLVHDVL